MGVISRNYQYAKECTTEEKKEHINYLELLATYRGKLLLKENLKNKKVAILTDSQVAIGFLGRESYIY